MKLLRWTIVLAVWALAATVAAAQSSSLYRRAAGEAAVLAGPQLVQMTAGAQATAAAQVSQPAAPAPAAEAVRSLIAAPEPEPRKFAKEDLITVIISESASHTTSAKVSTERDSSIDAKVEEFVRLHLGTHGPIRPINFPNGKPAIEAEASREFDGKGSAARTDTVTARVPVKVVEVKPNGNLLIEGTKSVEMDGDSFTITVAGVCRAEDVTPDNTILSTQIAELEVVKQSTGTVRDATKRGWLHRLLDWANLF